MTTESAAFTITIVGGIVAIILSARGHGKIGFAAFIALFVLSSWIILESQNAVHETDGREMMWGVMLVFAAFCLVLMVALRKRTDAIF